MKAEKRQRTLMNISKKTFLQVTALLLALLLLSIVLTYLLPKGEFGTLPDGRRDFSVYVPRPDLRGVPILRGIFAPVLVFFSSDGLTLLMLSLFLFVISASFQVMNDVGGIRALIGAVSARFRGRRRLLLALISFLFYCFGSFLGLFEEMLTMLPVVTALSVLAGYDSFAGFLSCIVACGFGFAGAITNPFTVLLASEIIGVNPLEHIWMRLLVFAVMFVLFLLFLFHYLDRLEKDQENSLTKTRDEALRLSGIGEAGEEDEGTLRRTRRIYTAFLLLSLLLIVVCSLSPALRGYTVVFLIGYFLIFGIAAGAAAAGSLRPVLQSFLRGLLGALPTLVFIALAASIKFVFDRGSVLPALVQGMNALAQGKSPFLVAAVIYLIVLLLEFFISSSTAKAILVMGLLAVVNVGLTKPMLVLIYTFADGYTNVLFPTSPVLLLSLAMIEADYFTWLKKSLPLFLWNLLLVMAFLALGILLQY